MPRSRFALLPVALAAVLAGCGGADEITTSAGAGNRYFGEHPGQEETSLRISAADCTALAATVHRQTGATLPRASDPTPPNSHCQLQGPGVHVSISLDAAHAARTRYSNRIDEQVQFNAADPAKVPHPVANVGDRGAYNQNATWIPAYSTLWAVRGNRWLTVVYSAAGDTRPRRLAAATPLARQAFRLTAR
jgi:capsular polysaccharide biosynthesis protein